MAVCSQKHESVVEPTPRTRRNCCCVVPSRHTACLKTELVSSGLASSKSFTIRRLLTAGCTIHRRREARGCDLALPRDGQVLSCLYGGSPFPCSSANRICLL